MTGTWGQRLAIREGRIGRVLVALMALGFAALLAAGIVAAWLTRQNQIHTGWVVHSYKVEVAIGEARRLIEQTETTRRGYLLSPATPGFLVSYRQAAAALPVAIAQLRGLTADNPAQQANLDELDRRLQPLLAHRAATIALIRQGRAEAAATLFRQELGAERLRAIRGLFDRTSAEERRLLAIRDVELARNVRIFYVVLAVTGLLLVAAAATSLAVVLRYTRDLTRSRNALRALADSLEAQVATRTADLSRANEELQRFAYIVSHDLRAPLVNVMGFTAELETATGAITALVDRVEQQAPALLDADARAAVREDLPEATGFIRISTQKMDRLINAILTLSRQGRRVLAPEPLDLPALVAGIRDTLAHRLDELDATVTVDGALPQLVSDRLAIEQILSNLIENAVKYRHPARPGRITVTGGREGARIWIAVTDNGRGIDARDHERVFDLFRRSGAQDQPGEGIGLAHVRALAYRLGGVIDLSSRLGEGSTFRLSLPAILAPQEDPA